MGGRFGKYGDAKRKGLIRMNRLREKNMFKTYARSARTSHLSLWANQNLTCLIQFGQQLIFSVEDNALMRTNSAA
jgi:hypothetical protein